MEGSSWLMPTMPLRMEGTLLAGKRSKGIYGFRFPEKKALVGEWDVLVSLLDDYPTICGLVGIEAFGDLDRVDLSGRLAE